MRPWIAAFLLFLPLCTAAQAAPTCQDRQGTTVRCGVKGAMPVGWVLPADEAAAHDAGHSLVSQLPKALQAVTLIALLLALFAVLPDFDGRTGADWDKQEDDDVP